MLIFTNVTGAIVCYSLERANRTNFLESQLLMETARRDGLTAKGEGKSSSPLPVGEVARSAGEGLHSN